jgi:hypothetical protein
MQSVSQLTSIRMNEREKQEDEITDVKKHDEQSAIFEQ